MCFTIEASVRVDARAGETLVVCQGRGLPSCDPVCGTGRAALYETHLLYNGNWLTYRFVSSPSTSILPRLLDGCPV
jgi:hypothetical protein